MDMNRNGLRNLGSSNARFYPPNGSGTSARRSHAGQCSTTLRRGLVSRTSASISVPHAGQKWPVPSQPVVVHASSMPLTPAARWSSPWGS